MRCSGAVFDMDGTILDSMGFWSDAGANFLKIRGIIPPSDLLEVLTPLSLAQTVVYLKKQFHLPESEEAIADEFNQMVERRYLNEFPAKRDALPFLEKLQSLVIPMCVATATDRYLAEAALKRLDMFQYFRFILTCTEVGHNKNEPVIFEKACSGLQVPKERVIIFEDSLHAIQTAKNAGFYTVAIQEDSVSADEPKIKQLADQFVHNFAEVIL